MNVAEDSEPFNFFIMWTEQCLSSTSSVVMITASANDASAQIQAKIGGWGFGFVQCCQLKCHIASHEESFHFVKRRQKPMKGVDFAC